MSNTQTVDTAHLAEIFKALSNPHRLRIFMRLVSCCAPEGSCCAESDMNTCAGEIGKDLGIAPSTVSHHLKELRVAGLIRTERRGKTVQYRIDLRNVREFSHIVIHELLPSQLIQ